MGTDTLVNTISEPAGILPAQPCDKPHEGAFNARQSEPDKKTTDGHFVRSRAEVIIDNWLYTYNIAHAYERKLPIADDNIYPDFFINQGKGIYIEYWGGSDPGYLSRKDQKIQTYERYGLQLIQLTDSDIHDLDNVLSRELAKYGIRLP